MDFNQNNGFSHIMHHTNTYQQVRKNLFNRVCWDSCSEYIDMVDYIIIASQTHLSCYKVGVFVTSLPCVSTKPGGIGPRNCKSQIHLCNFTNYGTTLNSQLSISFFNHLFSFFQDDISYFSALFQYFTFSFCVSIRSTVSFFRFAS